MSERGRFLKLAALGAVAIVGLATLTGGVYSYGLLSDTETSSSSVQAGTWLAVTSLGVSEVNAPGDHADFAASWEVGDPDGDLDTVKLTLRDINDSGDIEFIRRIDVNGSTASGTTHLHAKNDEGDGHRYEVELVVTDVAGNTASDTVTVVEDGE